jgi:hypothetical protein
LQVTVIPAFRSKRRGALGLKLGFDQDSTLQQGPHVVPYGATLDVPASTLLQFTIWLHQHRQDLRTREGIRAANCRTQALMVLRWFRDDTAVRMLAIDARLPISTAYQYLHEGITVLAAQAPDLHDVLTRAKAEGWSHLTLDGTLIETDRVAAKNPETGHDLWYSGKHKKQGGNVQILCDPKGLPRLVLTRRTRQHPRHHSRPDPRPARPLPGRRGRTTHPQQIHHDRDAQPDLDVALETGHVARTAAGVR